MKILLAIDGTEQSEAATEMFAALNLSDGDGIKIISIVDMAVPMAINPQNEFVLNAVEVEQAAQENAEKILETTRQRILEISGNKNLTVSTEVLFGSPESRIVETAENLAANLIIVGSHGYSRWERLLLGSVSDSVVHHAPCSVLVVRSSKKTFNLKMTQKQIVRINSRKFDQRIHKRWSAEILEITDSILTFVGRFEDEVRHPKIGVIRRNTVSYEFYWINRGYNIFRFHEPEGDLRNFYCNLSLPPKFENNVLDYVDLDIDVLVWKDFSYEILDVDEFEINATRFDYSQKLRDEVHSNLEKILMMIDLRTFPFDYKF